MSDSEGPAPTSAPSQNGSTSTTNNKQHVCVCTPSGHVPRPRNAFILYRQHHHSKVVAENPGKTNPEISKIIGEKWRSLSQEDKEIWIQMGDEEKKSHLMRFPDYRYQPRRSSKKGGGSGGGSTSGGVVGPTTCTVCKGITPAGLQQQQQQQQNSQQQNSQPLHYPGSAASSPTPTTPTSPVPQPRGTMSATSSPYGPHGDMYYRPPGSVPYYYPAPPSPTAPGAYPPYYRYALPMQPSSAQSPVPQFPPEPHSRQPSPLPGMNNTSGTYPEHYNESRLSSSSTTYSTYSSGGSVSSVSSGSNSESRFGSTSSIRTSSSSSISSSTFDDVKNTNYKQEDTYAQSLRSRVSTPPLSDMRKGVSSPTLSYSNQPWPFYQPSPAATTPGSPGSPASEQQPSTSNTTSSSHSHPYPSIPALQSDEHPSKKRRTSSYHDPLGGPGGMRGDISRYNASSAYSMSSSGMQSPYSSHSPTPAPVPAPPPPAAMPSHPSHNTGNELTAREKADILSMMCEPVKSVSRLIAIEGTDKALIKRITEKLSEKLEDSGASGIYCADLVRRRPPGLSTEFASNLWTLACLHQLVSDSKSKYVLMGGYLMDIADDVAAAHRSTTWAYRDRWVNGINLLQGLRGPDFLVYLQEGGPSAQGEVTVAELKGGMKMLIIMPGMEERLVEKIYEVVK